MYMGDSDNPSDVLSRSFPAADAAHLDRERLDRAFHVAVQMQFDGADLGQPQVEANNALFVCRAFLCVQFPACPIGVAK